MAEQLIESLDTDANIDLSPEWKKEVEKRCREVDEGVVTLRPANEVFEKAYLILLLQHMIEAGVAVHMVTTAGDYIEVDTEEDYALADRDWARRFGPPRH